MAVELNKQRSSRTLLAPLLAAHKRCLRKDPRRGSAFQLLKDHLIPWFAADPSRGLAALEVVLGSDRLRLLYDLSGGIPDERLLPAYSATKELPLAKDTAPEVRKQLKRPAASETETISAEPESAVGQQGRAKRGRKNASSKSSEAATNRQRPSFSKKAHRSTNSHQPAAPAKRKKSQKSGLAPLRLINAEHQSDAEAEAEAASEAEAVEAEAVEAEAVEAEGEAEADPESEGDEHGDAMPVAVFLEGLKRKLLPNPQLCSVSSTSSAVFVGTASNAPSSPAGTPVAPAGLNPDECQSSPPPPSEAATAPAAREWLTDAELGCLSLEVLRRRAVQRHRDLLCAKIDVIHTAFQLGRLLEACFRSHQEGSQQQEERDHATTIASSTGRATVQQWAQFLRSNGLPSVRYSRKLRMLALCLAPYRRLCNVAVSLSLLLRRAREVATYLEKHPLEAAFWDLPL